jgi:hypothetical protein
MVQIITLAVLNKSQEQEHRGTVGNYLSGVYVVNLAV